MTLEVETALVFYTAIFFTSLYVIKKWMIFGIFSFASWWVMGLMYLLLNPTATSTAYSIGWLFHVIGWVFLILVMAQIYDMWKSKKRGYERSVLD